MDSSSSARKRSGPTSWILFVEKKKLIVEVDGGQHAENTRDRARDRVLTADGYHIVRFWNSDVLSNRDGVLSMILTKLEEIVT